MMTQENVGVPVMVAVSLMVGLGILWAGMPVMVAVSLMVGLVVLWVALLSKSQFGVVMVAVKEMAERTFVKGLMKLNRLGFRR